MPEERFLKINCPGPEHVLRPGREVCIWL